MNAVEHIVECYFRYVKGCFTMSDVKIIGGNNRQCDLLAYSMTKGEQYHVESSVTHQENWCPSIQKLNEIFDKKFLGEPPKRDGKNTDYSKGKRYYENIIKTYQSVGLNPSLIKRVFVTWRVSDKENLNTFLKNYRKQHEIEVQVLCFRDEVLPSLMGNVSTSNYDDEVLRTLSLLRQRDLQG